MARTAKRRHTGSSAGNRDEAGSLRPLTWPPPHPQTGATVGTAAPHPAPRHTELRARPTAAGCYLRDAGPPPGGAHWSHLAGRGVKRNERGPTTVLHVVEWLTT